MNSDPGWIAAFAGNDGLYAGQCVGWVERAASAETQFGEGGSETHRGNRDMRWVSQGAQPIYELEDCEQPRKRRVDAKIQAHVISAVAWQAAPHREKNDTRPGYPAPQVQPGSQRLSGVRSGEDLSSFCNSCSA